MRKLKLKRNNKSFIYILKNQNKSNLNYGFYILYKSILLFNFIKLNIHIKSGYILSSNLIRYIIKFLKYTLKFN